MTRGGKRKGAGRPKDSTTTGSTEMVAGAWLSTPNQFAKRVMLTAAKRGKRRAFGDPGTGGMTT